MLFSESLRRVVQLEENNKNLGIGMYSGKGETALSFNAQILSITIIIIWIPYAAWSTGFSPSPSHSTLGSVNMKPSSTDTPQTTAKRQTTTSRTTRSFWFAHDPSKAYYEKFSLIWAPLSMLVLLAGVFGTDLHKHCDRDSFLAITVVGCLPGILIPLLFPCHADRGRPYSQRFWVKASTWLAIFGFYGNYFWTHYFYQLLGAEYLFDTYRFNDVPLVTFTATFFYFTFYFTFINVLLRRICVCTRAMSPLLQGIIWWTSIFLLSYGTAIFEAVSIQHFPLYTYKDRDTFLLVGSVVYGLYFVVGFPMFFHIDEQYSPSEEKKTPRATMWDVAKNALAATAIVLLLLDLWRIYLGSIYDLGSANIPLPFLYQGKSAFAAEAALHRI